MKRHFLTAALLPLLLACAAQRASAQEAVHPFTGKVRAALEAAEPAWKFSERFVKNTVDPKAEEIVFRRGARHVRVSVSVWGEESHAQGAIDGETRAFANLSRRHARLVRLRGPGDEAYMLASRQNRFERPVIFFREANVYVIIYAASDAVAKRFANRVAELVPEGGVALDAVY